MAFRLVDCSERCRKGPPGQGAGRLCGAEERRLAGRARTRALQPLTQCMQAMAMTTVSKAALWARIKALVR